MNELENRLENGLKTDGRLVIEGIKAGKKSGAVDYWDLIFSLEQAHENGEYERPDSFLCQYPDFADSIQAGEDYIQYTLEKARTAYTLWKKIYMAATDAKNQVGLDEMMEWGKVFASYYSEFRIALENQKNFLSCHLPALAKIKELKAELEKAKTSPEIISSLDVIKEMVSSALENQKANTAAVQKALAASNQKRRENEIPIPRAAEIIAEEARNLKMDQLFDRGSYVSSSTNEKNIKNWEAERNPCPWPDGFPSRRQPELDFRIKVRRGLEKYIARIKRARRRREEKKMKENLGVDDPDHFNGISIDNPPEKYKAIIERALIDPYIEDEYPTFAYFDDKVEEKPDREEIFGIEFFERIYKIFDEISGNNDDAFDDDDEFDDDEFDDDEIDDDE